MKTWADVERAALENPVLMQAVVLVHRGDLTREQAMIAVALGLVEANAKLQKYASDLLAVTPTRHIFIPHGSEISKP